MIWVVGGPMYDKVSIASSAHLPHIPSMPSPQISYQFQKGPNYLNHAPCFTSGRKGLLPNLLEATDHLGTLPPPRNVAKHDQYILNL